MEVCLGNAAGKENQKVRPARGGFMIFAAELADAFLHVAKWAIIFAVTLFGGLCLAVLVSKLAYGLI